MPIDLALFRPSREGGILEEVEKWQELRYGKNKETKELLENLCDWDLERRAQLKQLTEARARLNALQRSLAPRKNKQEQYLNESIDPDKVRSEINELKSKRIPELEKKHGEVTARIEQSLPKVANYVDTAPLNDSSVEMSSQVRMNLSRSGEKDITQSRNASELVLDPLFCLGGYENVRVGDADAAKIVVLTGIGAALGRGLSDYALIFFIEQEEESSTGHKKLSNFQLVNLPDSVAVPQSLAHALLGCPPAICKRRCRVCQAESQQRNSSVVIKALPLVAFSMLHGNKTYWDRQLPQAFVSISKSKGAEQEPIQSRTSSGSEKKKNIPSWMDRIHDLEQIEIFCLTTCSLAEARRLQINIVHQIVAFHQSLLLQAAGKFSMLHQASQNELPTDLVQCRSLPPDELLPNEASRIVIEGYVPSTQQYATLGFVSNLADYASRGCKTKCGGMVVEYVYTLHGTLCSVAEITEWVAQNNVVQLLETCEMGVGLPAPLVPFLRIGIGRHNDKRDTMSQESFLFVPFRRRLLRSKNGKTTVTELNNSSEPRLVDSTEQCHGKDSKATRDPKSTEFPTPGSDSAESERKPFVRDRFPTRDEIKAEALSCRYSFLPIGL